MTRVIRPRLAQPLGALLVLALGCSGDVNSLDGTATPPPTNAVTSPSIVAPGTLPNMPTAPQPGPSSGAPNITPTSMGTIPVPGVTVPEDPNAIPDAPPAATLVATPRFARLSRLQWSNSIRQLLHLEQEDTAAIEAEVSGDALINFDTEADALFVTEQLRRQLADAAERLADLVTTNPSALAALEVNDPPADVGARAQSFVSGFGLRAFRRPLTESEVATHLALFDQGPSLYPERDAFEAGASLVIQAMLQSPHFLYRTELGQGNGGAAVPLDDFEVASKLAFSLTNTMPSDELLEAAAAGQLRDKASIAAQAKRLLDDVKGLDGIANFSAQVLRLGTYDGIRRDPEVFPDFSPDAPAAMKKEVLQFVEWVFKEGGGVKDYYTSAVGFVNSDLAPLYEVEGNFSKEEFTQVDLDPTKRAGLLTQAGFLSSYISDTQPDIIHRGVFIATRLLCLTLPPPDPNADLVIEVTPGMTNRQRVETTTGKGTCGEGCHSILLNPLGYAFENYDAVGKYRTTDQGLPVDASATYTLDGQTQTFSNGVELSHLLADAKQTHKCYAQNLMKYLHGRTLTPDDEAIVDYYARLSRADMLSVRDMMLEVVTSDAFLSRLP